MPHDWSQEPGSDHWDILLDKAERFRQQQSTKFDQAYGAFSDTSPCFPDDCRHLTISKNINGIDHVIITEQLNDMLKQENKALFYARFYRD